MTRAVAAFASVLTGLVLVGCASASFGPEGERRVTQLSEHGLSHSQTTSFQKVWKREVHRQHVRLDAVVATLRKPGAPGRGETCPDGPMIRIVIAGRFPAHSDMTTYEDLLATPRGHICLRTYQQTPPPGIPASRLERRYDVPNSG